MPMPLPAPVAKLQTRFVPTPRTVTHVIVSASTIVQGRVVKLK